MTAITDNQKPEKRKRGRPKKEVTTSSTNNSLPFKSIAETDSLFSSDEGLESKVDDWEQELDEKSIPADLDLEVSNAAVGDATVLQGGDDELDACLDEHPENLEIPLCAPWRTNSHTSDTTLSGECTGDAVNVLQSDTPQSSVSIDAAKSDGDMVTKNQEESQTLTSAQENEEIINQEESQTLTSAQENEQIENQEEIIKLPTTIHIIDGEKGGCGKSFVSRAFIEYCASIGCDVAIVDADTSNQDIAKIYPNVDLAFFSDDEKQAKEADKIFDLAFEKSVIVNLPAQVYSNVTNWIKRNDLTEVGQENSITFIKWFVCTGGVDSVNFFLQSLEELGEMMTHVFVKNLGLCDDWKYIDEMPEFVEAQNKYEFTVMNFPKFPFWERNMVDRLKLTFEGALIHPEFKVVSKQRVKNFLKEAYAAFALTNLVF